MNETVQQVTSVMNQIITKCTGPTYGEFATLQQCVLQLTSTIEAQDKKIQEYEQEIEALVGTHEDDAS